MPFLPVAQQVPEVLIGLWRVEEEERFFLDRLSLYENELRIISRISHPVRRLEWLSSRLCLKELLNIRHPVESLNESTGKPYLSDGSFHISYSHSNRMSGAIASASSLVSMDLEDLSKKRNPQTRFLFMHPEELLAYERAQDLRVFFLIWSAKETLYKLYAKKGLVFKENLIINPDQAPIGQEGVIGGLIIENGDTHTYPIHYRFYPDVLLTYTHGPVGLW